LGEQAVLAFKDLEFTWYLDFDIWNLVNEIATPSTQRHECWARNDILSFVIASAGKASRSNLGGARKLNEHC
jgi:hypothetical protein